MTRKVWEYETFEKFRKSAKADANFGAVPSFLQGSSTTLRPKARISVAPAAITNSKYPSAPSILPATTTSTVMHTPPLKSGPPSSAPEPRTSSFPAAYPNISQLRLPPIKEFYPLQPLIRNDSARKTYTEKYFPRAKSFEEQELLSPDELRFWCVDLSDNEVLDALHYARSDGQVKPAALYELVERGHSTMAEYVVVALHEPILERRFRDALLLVADGIIVLDDYLREKFAEALLCHAHALYQEAVPAYGARATTPLWAAIWRYATLRFEADVGALVDFMHFTDPLPHVHAVLLAIGNAFKAAPPIQREIPALIALRQRVVEFADRYIDPAKLQTSDERALALTSYCVAVVLLVDEMPRLTLRIIALKKQWIFTYVLRQLDEAFENWNAAHVDGPVEGAIGALRETIHQIRHAQKRMIESPA
ncbi:MAG TPA: hypothetical protein PK156_41080 [Polyangium sp.]|nr:hypothetical protein [Polyangium sp.]